MNLSILRRERTVREARWGALFAATFSALALWAFRGVARTPATIGAAQAEVALIGRGDGSDHVLDASAVYLILVALAIQGFGIVSARFGFGPRVQPVERMLPMPTRSVVLQRMAGTWIGLMAPLVGGALVWALALRSAEEAALLGLVVLRGATALTFAVALLFAVYLGQGERTDEFADEVFVGSAAEGLPALAAELQARDPVLAARLDLSNPRRVMRAWEVLEATGRPLSAWPAETAPPTRTRRTGAARCASSSRRSASIRTASARPRPACASDSSAGAPRPPRRASTGPRSTRWGPNRSAEPLRSRGSRRRRSHPSSTGRRSCTSSRTAVSHRTSSRASSSTEASNVPARSSTRGAGASA